MLRLISPNEIVENEQTLEITQDSPLFNHYSTIPSYSGPYAMHKYTKSLVRNILLRDPSTEIELRNLPEAGIVCTHEGYDCHCKRLVTIKNIIESCPTYEEGIRYLASLFYPTIHLDIEEEGSTHINISPVSKNKLGREVWHFLMEKFKYSENGPSISIMEMTGSLFYNKGLQSLPVVLDKGDIIKHEAVIKDIVLDRLKTSNSDLLEELGQNTLPFSMYINDSLTGGIRTAIDVDDSWIPAMFNEIGEGFRTMNYSKLAVIINDPLLTGTDILQGLESIEMQFDEIIFFIKDLVQLYALASIKNVIGAEYKIRYELLPSDISPLLFKDFESVVKMKMEDDVVVVTHRSQEAS